MGFLKFIGKYKGFDFKTASEHVPICKSKNHLISLKHQMERGIEYDKNIGVLGILLTGFLAFTTQSIGLENNPTLKRIMVISLAVYTFFITYMVYRMTRRSYRRMALKSQIERRLNLLLGQESIRENRLQRRRQ